MKLATRLAAIVTAGVPSAGALTGIAPAAYAAGTGCPSGYVCVYPAGSWNGGRPQLKWEAYGAHNLSNMYGTHRVYNNQTGGATASLCTAYDGGGCGAFRAPGWYADVNLTPINSIDLATTAVGPSKVGGTITQTEIRRRLRDWYLRGPAYSQSGHIWDLGDTRHYRTDCSGLADMALHLSADDNTSAIAGDTARFVRRYALSSTPRSKLNSSTVQSGDVFDDTIDGHAFVFASWNSDGSFNYYNFGGGSSGVAPPEYHTRAHMTDSYLGFERSSHYVIYRYRNVRG